MRFAILSHLHGCARFVRISIKLAQQGKFLNPTLPHAILHHYLRAFPRAEVHVRQVGVVLEDDADAPVGVVRRVALLHQPRKNLPHRRPLQGRHLRRRACRMEDLRERVQFIPAFRFLFAFKIPHRKCSLVYPNIQYYYLRIKSRTAELDGENALSDIPLAFYLDICWSNFRKVRFPNPILMFLWQF